MDRTKYIQSGTGQVGYLSFIETDKSWVFELFAGGPDGYQTVAQWETRDEADRWLAEQEFEPELV